MLGKGVGVSVLAGVGALLVAHPPSAAAADVHSTKLTVDSVVDVSDGRIVVSGRVFTRGFYCEDRAVRLVGTKTNGKAVELDWDLTSLPGAAFGLTSKYAGFEPIRVQVSKTKHGHGKHRVICAGASKVVFPIAP